MALQPGQVLDGKYKIVRVIGEGGMGAVYEGENTRIRRRVAIKLLHAGVAANTEMVQRFEREAQVAGTVGNDHILEILDLGALPSGERYMVMEYLDGVTLTERIKMRVRLSAQEAVQLIRQVLRGLGAAHGAGIVHRDLKPDNIFILREKAGIRDYVKIIDFGISKFSEQNGASSRMTRTGALMGTPHYMAPEQATGSMDIDRRTDIYAVGIIMYETLTGRVPFQAETFNQLLFEIALAKIIPARQVVPDLDPAIDSIIMKASARDPAQRFQTCEEFVLALEAWEKTGTAVSLPATESIEAIVAATVPRAGQGFGSTDATVSSNTGNTGRASQSSVSGNTGAGRVSKSSVAGTASAVSAAPPGSSIPVDPTVNTWANASVARPPQRSAAPIIAATALGVLLLAGAGIGAYFFFRAPSASVASAGSAVAPPPGPTVAASDTVAVREAPPATAKAPDVAPTTTPTTVTPATPSSETASAESHAAQHGTPATAHHKPSTKPEPSKPKPAINFGY
ncbi:MAG TPA: protein kinase [Polyangiaceae bacterium]|jgi:serine/threonine-protein kinase|nr:protein kinase [Polyangiaceae bacterium]